MLFVGLGAGVLVLFGVIGAGVFVATGNKGDTKPLGSSTASAPSASLAPPPPPPPTPDTTATAESPVTADSGAIAMDEIVDAEAAPTPTTTATTTSQPAPPSTEVSPQPIAPAPTREKEKEPPPDPNAWNEAAARSRLGQANSILVFCKKADGVTGPGTASVTFNTDGTVRAVSMDPPYAGTPAGDCVSGHFKRVKVSAFHGSPQTLKHTFEIPK